MKVILLIASFIGVLFLLPKLFGFLWGGYRYGNKIAASIGMKNKLFHTAIEYGGLGNNSLRTLEAIRRNGVSPFDAAPMFGQLLVDGLERLESQFGPQPQIQQAKPIAYRLLQRAEELGRQL